MKPTTEELIRRFKEYSKIGQFDDDSYIRLRGRLDVLEEWDNLEQYEFQSKWIKEEISKIKEVLS